ncbi:Retrovirus-related Pol polyprotein, partial [Mucuna pruriens]
MCNASNSALGVILGQRAGVGKPVHVISYASRTMDLAQSNYTTTEKELLEIVFALDKFCSYLLASQFPPKTSQLYKENSKVMPNTTFGMILTYGDFAVIKCIPKADINSVLQLCHAAPRGKHYGSTRTARKVLDCSLYWPIIFRDAYQFVSTYDKG